MDPSSSKRETSRQWSDGLKAGARATQHLGKGGVVESPSRPPASKPVERGTSSPGRSEMGSVGADAPGTSRRRQQQVADESCIRRDSHSENDDTTAPSEKSELSGAERDAAHFKMVAERFRALMERRERRLEEAMSDPQTRTDLEAMFPGMKQGDYQTLLAGVRGMEEEDFQMLLAGARRRRQEVRYHFSRARVLAAKADTIRAT